MGNPCQDQDQDRVKPRRRLACTPTNCIPSQSGGRLVCTALVDQCCTGKGLIAHDLADALGCGITESAETTIYKTAGGNFESRSEISIPDAMLPCFTAQRSFKVVFNVMPKEVSIDATYGVIIGQDTMRELKIDTSVLTNSITWDSLTTPMVPRRYWSHETIILNREKLSQPPTQNLSNVEVPNKEVLHDEADEPSYASNFIPSATASRVEEDIVEMHKICKE